MMRWTEGREQDLSLREYLTSGLRGQMNLPLDDTERSLTTLRCASLTSLKATRSSCFALRDRG